MNDRRAVFSCLNEADKSDSISFPSVSNKQMENRKLKSALENIGKMPILFLICFKLYCRSRWFNLCCLVFSLRCSVISIFSYFYVLLYLVLFLVHTAGNVT